MEQSYNTTLTSKGQLTVPKAIRRRLAIDTGVKLEVSSQGSGFFVQPKRRPAILDLAGSLKKYDDGRPWHVVIEEAKMKAITKRLKLKKSVHKK